MARRHKKGKPEPPSRLRPFCESSDDAMYLRIAQFPNPRWALRSSYGEWRPSGYNNSQVTSKPYLLRISEGCRPVVGVTYAISPVILSWCKRLFSTVIGDPAPPPARIECVDDCNFLGRSLSNVRCSQNGNIMSLRDLALENRSPLAVAATAVCAHHSSCSSLPERTPHSRQGASHFRHGWTTALVEFSATGLSRQIDVHDGRGDSARHSRNVAFGLRYSAAVPVRCHR